MNFLQKSMRKFWSICFYSRLSLHGLLGLPAQTSKERRIFKAIFNHLAAGKPKVFEWGSGYSTIYYSKYLKNRKIDFEWHAIDNNKLWHKKVSSKIKSGSCRENVRLYLKEFLPFWLKPGWQDASRVCGAFSPKEENEIAYINLPKVIGSKFDVVIIDARFRRHCLEVARQVVAPGGIVVIHDAQKPHYQTGVENFPFQKFINTGKWALFQELPNKLWIGTFDNRGLFDSLN